MLNWLRAFRAQQPSSSLTRAQVHDLVSGIFDNSWKLNLSHFLRWLTLCGLVRTGDDADVDAPGLASSTNANCFLRLCKAWQWKHTFESLHASCLEHLRKLETTQANYDKLIALAANIAVEDTPGNACKAICCAETFLYGGSTNAPSHTLVVSPSALGRALVSKFTFHA